MWICIFNNLAESQALKWSRGCVYLLLCQNVFDAYKYISVLGYVFGSYLNFLIIFFSELIVDMYLNTWRKSYKNNQHFQFLYGIL